MIKRVSYNSDGSAYEYTEDPEPKQDFAFIWHIVLVVNTIWTVMHAFDIHQLQSQPIYITPNVPTHASP